jgi:hypothetical protein
MNKSKKKNRTYKKRGGDKVIDIHSNSILTTNSDFLQQQYNLKMTDTVSEESLINIRNNDSIIEKNKLFAKFLTTEENIKIIKNIPSIYKSKIIQIFKNFKDTNNGLIIGEISDEIKELYTDILTNHDESIKLLTGGGTPINTKNIDILRQLNTYCRDISRYGINDENDIQDYFTNPRSMSIINNDEYSDLRNCIESRISENFSINISRNPRYNFFSGNKDDYVTHNDITKSYDCFDYNKDIVTAYEANYYTKRNKNAIENFITKQKEYIESLGIREKRIIQDYTNDSSFRFYCEYKNPKRVANWINNRNFGDAFYVQIYELFTDASTDNATLQNIFGHNAINYEEWLSGNRIGNTIQSVINLTDEKWYNVLDKFMKDLDNVIINAPPIEEEIYCYRGVSDHYIMNGQPSEPIELSDNNGKTIYTHSIISNRLSSFSLDFYTSYRFYNRGLNPKSALYKIAILPQCRVLYVEQLSVCDGEFEFIAPSNSIFYYKVDDKGSDLVPLYCYNNISKKYGICSSRNAIRSFDSILAFTPQPELTDDIKNNALKIVEKTQELFQQGYLTITEGAAFVAPIFDDAGPLIGNFLNICSCCPY